MQSDLSPSAPQPRRNFIKTLGGIAAGFAAMPSLDAKSAKKPLASANQVRRAGSSYLGGFAAPKLDRVKVAIIGVGERGLSHVIQLSQIEGVDFVGICDLHEGRAKSAEQFTLQHGHKAKLYTGDAEGWKKMLADLKPDAVFIVTPWDLHATQAIGAMNAGAHAFVELPLGLTIAEMWQIIDTAEATKRHCMLMENCNYGREELLYLNMVRQGVIGELLHGEAAYIHGLRHQMENGNTTGSWRTHQYAKRNGNLYPCHGLGPISQYMNIARGDDHFRKLVSFSSPAKGRAIYAEKSQKLSDNEFKKLNYVCGDINSSLIKTHLGRTIIVQWDETSPRPYSRQNMIQGTLGILKGFPNGMAIEGITKDYHSWTSSEEFEQIAAKYEHPLYKRVGPMAEKMGGHGGMDFLMLYRIIECLRNGSPLDQNVYEGCSWSAVAPLSESSVKNDGEAQEFPDFTRGDWKSTKPLAIIP